MRSKAKRVNNFSVFLFLLALTIFFLGYSANPRLYSYIPFPRASSNLLIITQDGWVTTTAIQSFVSWKETEGYVVDVVGLQEVYNAFPVPPQPQVVKATEVRLVEGSSSYIKGLVLFFIENGNIQLFGNVDLNGVWHIRNVATTPKTVYVWNMQYWLSGVQFTITYFDGVSANSLVVQLPRGLMGYWGNVALTPSGGVTFIEDEAWSVVRYIRFRGFEYVLLVGRSTVPSWPSRYFIPSADGTVTASLGVTDDPYSVSNFDGNYDLRNNRIYGVGRVPTDDLNEVQLILDKTMRFTPFASKNILYMRGEPLSVPADQWQTDYQNFKTQTFMNIQKLNQEATIVEVVEPGDSELRNSLSNEKSYTLIWAHGDKTTAHFTWGGQLTELDFNYISNKLSNIVLAVACSIGSFDAPNFLAGSFLRDTNSETVAAVAPSTVVAATEGSNLIESFLSQVPTSETLGLSFLNAKKQNVADWWVSVSHNLFGDPSLKLTAPPPPPPEVGTLTIIAQEDIDGDNVWSPVDSLPVTVTNATHSLTWVTDSEGVAEGTVTVGNYSAQATFQGYSDSDEGAVAAGAKTILYLYFGSSTPPEPPPSPPEIPYEIIVPTLVIVLVLVAVYVKISQPEVPDILWYLPE